MKKTAILLIGIFLTLLVMGCGPGESVPVTGATKFIDETGAAYGIEREDNRPYVIAPSFELLVAAGDIPGFFSVNKFGRNIEVDNNVTADVWDGGFTVGSGGVSLIWVAPTQARLHQIASTSGSDDGSPAGVGARTLRIFGLPDWDTAEITEDLILNGTTNVTTSNSYVIIYRMEVLTKGATSSNVGTITATADSDGTITAQISPSAGRTQMAILGISSSQTAYMGRFYANINKAGGATALTDIKLCYNPEPDVELTNFMVSHTFGLQTVGTSAFTIPFYAPKAFVGPGILKVQALSGSNDIDISAGFDVIIVNNN